MSKSNKSKSKTVITAEQRNAVKQRATSHAKAAHNANAKTKAFAKQNNAARVKLINDTAIANKCERDAFNTRVATQCAAINAVILRDKKATHTVESVRLATNAVIADVLIRRHFDSLVTRHCVCKFASNKSSVQYVCDYDDARAVAAREKLASK